jgi:hypothetical protein
MRASLTNLIDEFSRAFGPPFLPKGFFKAEPDGKGLRMEIGDRTLILDGKGRLESSGSNVGTGRQWDIKRR